MGKKDRKSSPAETAESFGVGQLTRHLFVCLGPDCVDSDNGEKTWDYVKRRMKELNIAGPSGPCYRTKVGCLRDCWRRPDRARVSRRGVVSRRHARERRAHHPAALDRRANRRRPVLRKESAWASRGPLTVPIVLSCACFGQPGMMGVRVDDGHAPVAQLDRAPAFEAVGRGSNPSRAHHDSRQS